VASGSIEGKRRGWGESGKERDIVTSRREPGHSRNLHH